MHKHAQVTDTHSQLTVHPLLLNAILSTHIHRYIKPKANAYVGGKTFLQFPTPLES